MIKVINSTVAVDDDTFAPMAVLTIAIPMEPASDDIPKDADEARALLASDIATALELYHKESPPQPFTKALPLSEYFAEDDKEN